MVQQAMHHKVSRRMKYISRDCVCFCYKREPDALYCCLSGQFPVPPVGFVWKSCLCCDLEDFDFLHLEIPRPRENRVPVQSGVVRISPPL
jgi:hypothetical protein